MSVAVVTCSPRTCSGLAYSGVISCKPGRVAAARGWPISSALEQLGNAEVREFRYTVRRHEYVGRLDVAMDDQVLVRVLHGAAQQPEEVAAERPCRDRGP
jgi:hypothetical protein